MSATQTFLAKTVLKRTSAIIAGNASMFMALSTALGLPALIGILVLGGGDMSTVAHAPTALLSGIIPLLCTVLLQIALVRIANNYLNGSSTTLKEAFSFDAKQMIALLLIDLAVDALPLLPQKILLFGAALFLRLLAGLCISIPLCIIDDAGFQDALNRSWEATAGHRWKISGLLVIYIAIFALLDVGAGLALGVPPGVVASKTVPYQVAAWFAGLVGTVLSTTGLTAIYWELAPSREVAIPASLRAI